MGSRRAGSRRARSWCISNFLPNGHKHKHPVGDSAGRRNHGEREELEVGARPERGRAGRLGSAVGSRPITTTSRRFHIAGRDETDNSPVEEQPSIIESLQPLGRSPSGVGWGEPQSTIVVSLTMLDYSATPAQGGRRERTARAVGGTFPRRPGHTPGNVARCSRARGSGGDGDSDRGR